MKFADLLKSFQLELQKLERKHANKQSEANKKAVQALREIATKLDSLVTLAFDAVVDKLTKKNSDTSRLSELVNQIGPNGLPVIIQADALKVSTDHVFAIDEANAELTEIIIIHLQLFVTKVEDIVLRALCNEHSDKIEQYQRDLANNLNRGRQNQKVASLMLQKRTIDDELGGIDVAIATVMGVFIAQQGVTVDAVINVLRQSTALVIACRKKSEPLPTDEVQFMRDEPEYANLVDIQSKRTNIRLAIVHSGLTLLERLEQICKNINVTSPPSALTDVLGQIIDLKQKQNTIFIEMLANQYIRTEQQQYQHLWQLTLSRKIDADIKKIEILLPKVKADNSSSFFSSSTKELIANNEPYKLLPKEIVPLREFTVALKSRRALLQDFIFCQTADAVEMVQGTIAAIRSLCASFHMAYLSEEYGRVDVTKHPICLYMGQAKYDHYPTLAEFVTQLKEEQEVSASTKAAVTDKVPAPTYSAIL
jgi:hypothetical protein